MTPAQLRTILEHVREGRTDTTQAYDQLLGAFRDQPFEDLGFAKVDHHRSMRQGFAEVILGLGKTPSQIATIAAGIVGRGHPLLVTRTDETAWKAVQAAVPEAEYHEAARCITVKREVPMGVGTIALCSAGTSDIPVAEEAGITAELMGNTVDRLYDVGVAGIHRILNQRARLEAARVIIVVAGMEGALPSVVGGLTAAPVIAVPTSIGYGASFNGLAALLAMLNSCASGIAVMNIDNGFGAAALAARILRPR